jgi:hypothetical protein
LYPSWSIKPSVLFASVYDSNDRSTCWEVQLLALALKIWLPSCCLGLVDESSLLEGPLGRLCQVSGIYRLGEYRHNCHTERCFLSNNLLMHACCYTWDNQVVEVLVLLGQLAWLDWHDAVADKALVQILQVELELAAAIDIDSAAPDIVVVIKVGQN